MLNISAAEWWEMQPVERAAYERGMQKWLPHILYGSDAIQADHPTGGARGRKKTTTTKSVTDLPGGEIVRGY